MDYYQGYEDAMRQARVRRNSGLIVISILYGAFIYVPLLLFGYWLANKISPLYSSDTIIRFALTSIFAFLSFAIIYFIKGLLIGLRTRGQSLWLILWVLCVLLTSGIQSYMAQSLLENFFHSKNVANAEMWSWLGAALVALLIYSHYQFLSNVAPRSVFWSYRLGFFSARQRAATFDKVRPLKSDSYFQNAPMKISHRKID
jgi:hypothetical protein